MKISLNLLKEFVNLKDLAPETIIEKLGFIGFEVASVEKKAYKFDELITAVEIREIKQHPNADRLKLCTVTDGLTSQEVVCGAPNVYVGMKCFLAREGAVLPDGTQIKEAQIRGVVSKGMLCSSKELALTDDVSGLLELEKGFELGKTLASSLPSSDVILDIELTANRPDCLSHIGIARELACAYKEALKFPEVWKNIKKSAMRKVFIEDAALCKRYYAVYIEEVEIGPAPLWMRMYLFNCGIRSINNIVDITNYVLIELGHPMHAFDQKNVEGGEIHVRLSAANEEILALDGKAYELDGTTLVIADKIKPIAIAGIMGGEYSSVHSDTTQLVLESAYFNPLAIRRTSRKLGLSSQSSILFERGTDIENVYFSSRRAAFLIEKYAHGMIATFEDHYPERFENISIDLRHSQVERVLGKKYEPRQNIELLSRLGLELVTHNDNVSRLKVPSFRYDLRDEIDLIEEIARGNGYEDIPARVMVDFVQPEITRSWQEYHKFISILSSIGLREAKNYGFFSNTMCDIFKLAENDPRRDLVKINNPISQETAFMNSFLLPNLALNVARNLNQQNKDIRLFEIAHVFRAGSGSIEEKRMIAGVVYQGEPERAWPINHLRVDYYYMAGLVKFFLKQLGIVNYQIKKANNPYSHPKLSVSVYAGEDYLGEFGALHPAIGKHFDFDHDLYYLEFDCESLSANMKNEIKFKPFSKYPAANRDISLIFDEQITWQEIKTAIDDVNKGYIEDVRVFDVYKDDKIGKNKKSISFGVQFRAEDKTLTDKEADKLRDSITNALTEKFKAQLRA